MDNDKIKELEAKLAELLAQAEIENFHACRHYSSRLEAQAIRYNRIDRIRTRLEQYQKAPNE